jgi:hypothetical protein
MKERKNGKETIKYDNEGISHCFSFVALPQRAK